MPTMPQPLSPQCQLVIDYLKSGRSLTPMIAMISLGVASLTSRVAELRQVKDAEGKQVYPVKDKWEEDHHKRRYKKYWMGEKEPADEAVPSA